MIDALRIFTAGLLTGWGQSAQSAARWSQVVAVVTVLIVTLLLAAACRRWLIPVILKVVAKTDTKWDDYFINRPVLVALCQLVPSLLTYAALPLCVDNHDALLFTALCHIVEAYIALSVVMLVVAFLRNLSAVAIELYAEHHLVGILQFLRLLAFSLGGIIVVSLLFGYDPTKVVTGLGAAATVLLLVFKDTLLGLMAGIQLSTNKMLKVGDWITLPKLGINGKVEEITLMTVKVRNFDNTIATVPPYTLLTDSFQNWEGMVSRGRRRVKRALYVDIRSVRVCQPKTLNELLTAKLVSDEDAACPTVTNLTLYRHYIDRCLKAAKIVADDQWVIVRQLDPTPEGLPVELWFYLNETEFARFEDEAAKLMEQFIAMAPRFLIQLYQRPSGNDLETLARPGTAPAYPQESRFHGTIRRW